MAVQSRSYPLARLPLDASALRSQQARERAAEIEYVRSRADQHAVVARRLDGPAEHALAWPRSVALALAGLAAAPLALACFTSQGVSITEAAVLAAGLLGAGLLLTDRSSRELADPTQAATLLLLAVGGAAVWWGLARSSGGHPQWPSAALTGLMAGSLLLLPGFAVDEAARWGARWHRSAELRLRTQLRALEHPGTVVRGTTEAKEVNV